MAADRVAAADAPEHPSVPDPGRVQPGTQRRDRAVGGERVGGDVDADAFAFLVRLGAGQQHAQSVRPEAEVRHPDHHQLGAAEGAGEAEQNEGAVAFAAPVAATDRGDPQHVGGEQRRRLALRLCRGAGRCLAGSGAAPGRARRRRAGRAPGRWRRAGRSGCVGAWPASSARCVEFPLRFQLVPCRFSSVADGIVGGEGRLTGHRPAADA